MLPVRTEREPHKVTLVRIRAQAPVWKVGQSVFLKIQDRDGLVCLRLLCSIAEIEQCGVAMVGARRHRSRKAVHKTEPPHCRRGQLLARGKVDRLTVGWLGKRGDA